MKLTNIKQSDKKDIITEKKNEQIEEHTGPIPGMSMSDPDYEVMRKRFTKIKQTNPSLYKRMMNWD